MLALLNWRIWAAIAIALAMAAACWKSYSMGKAQVQAEWNAEKLEHARLSIALASQTAKTTAELQTNSDKEKEVLHAKVNRIASERDRLAYELRNRPERPTGGNVSETAGNGTSITGATGKGLYAEDARFSLGEAADAAILQAGLKACYAQYADARNKLEALKKKE